MNINYKTLKRSVCHLGTLGFLTILFGAIMGFYGFPAIVKSQIAQRIALENGTVGYNLWKDMPFPLMFKVYFFNVTNPEDIVSGAKPKLKEIGPYVYDEFRYKDNIIREDTDTISYDLKRVFKFNEKKSSPLKESDIVTILDMAKVGIYNTANKILPAMISELDRIIPYLFTESVNPFITTSVEDILFNGKFINCSYPDSTVEMICQYLKSRSPPTIRESEIEDGFYYSMFSHINNTRDGPYSINSGIKDTSKLGNIVSYKNKSTVDAWSDDCAVIQGSDTTVFAPIDESNFTKMIYIFQPDVCRSMYANFTKKKMTFGLQTYRFETTKSVLGSRDKYSANKCFCPDNWSGIHDGCQINGVQGLEHCQGAPVVVSFPHFYLADKILLDYIDDGVKPVKDKHETYVEIEPKTGAPMKGAKRIQFNMELQRMSSVPMFSSVEPGLFPIVWIEEGAEVNDNVKSMLQSVHDKIKYLKVLQWIIIAIGIIVMLASCHFKRRGMVDKCSWTPNRVEMDMPSYGMSRPAAAQKEGRFNSYQNKGFCNTEMVAHK